MKDQRARKSTMMSQMRADGFDPSKKQRQVVEESIIAPTVTDEEIAKIRLYNSQVTTLNPDYTNLKMINNILVRCFLYEPLVSESGLYQPFKTQVTVKTANGMDAMKDVENHFPYSLKAVIISAPENYTAIKAGDIVQLRRNAIQDGAVGDLKHGFFLRVENAFAKIGVNPVETPKDSDHPDYGYITINYADIQCLLQQ